MGIAVAAFTALVLLWPPAASARGKGAVGSQTPIPQQGTTIGFWAGEAVPGTDWGSPDTYWRRRDLHAYTPYLWRVLRHNQIPLYFNLRYKRDFGPVPPGKPHRHDGLKIIRKANRLGVPVWAWILIPYSDGYWAWEGAAAEQFAATRALVSWARKKHVELRGVALDPEPPVRTPFDTAAALLGGGSDATLSALFQQSIDPLGQCAAWRGYARIARWAKHHRVKIAAAPAPAVLDDLKDRSLALQDATGLIVPSAPWDELYFQAYRSVFAYHWGRDPGSGIVSSYLRSARHDFGRVGEISLGSAGRGPYRRFPRLLNDVRLAATLGASEVPIYSLERTLRSYGGPRALLRLVQAARHPFAGPAASKSTAPTSRAINLRAAIHRTDIAASANTPTVTASHGASLPPNRWPHGCS